MKSIVRAYIIKVQVYVIKRRLQELVTGFKESVARFISIIKRLRTNFKKLIPNFVKLVDRTLFSCALCGVTLFVCAEQILRQSARKVSNWMAGRQQENGNVLYYLGLFGTTAIALVAIKTLFMMDPLIVCLATVAFTIRVTLIEIEAPSAGGNECSILNIAKVYPEVHRRIEEKWVQNKGGDIDQEVDQYFDDKDNYRAECSINSV